MVNNGLNTFQMRVNKRLQKLFIAVIVFAASVGFVQFANSNQKVDEQILAYVIDPQKSNLQLYWKNDEGEILKSIANLKSFVESKKSKLVFAANAGMYKSDFTPQGLFIQNKKVITPIDTGNGYGNFYLKPNGVFYINKDNNALVSTTNNFKMNDNIKFATQSGPMLVVNGEIHTAFKQGSSNLNIRNGVGILPNNHILFAMSKKEINFYDFALYFKTQGCKNALYLDGFVSRTYLPEKNWVQTDGQFGVMIGVTE